MLTPPQRLAEIENMKRRRHEIELFQMYAVNAE